MKLHNNSILPAPSEERIESFQDYCQFFFFQDSKKSNITAFTMTLSE